MNNKLGKFGCLFGNFTNACCGVFANLHINVFETVQDAWEDFCFNYNFGKINGVLGNLSKTLANVALKLGIRV